MSEISMADNPNRPAQEQSKPIELTQADVDRIMSLPERTFIIGNIATRGLYDEANRRFYLLDENGNWTRRVAIIKSPIQSSDEPDEHLDEQDSDDEDAAPEDSQPEQVTNNKGRLRSMFTKVKNSPDVAEAKMSVMDKLTSPICKRLPLTWLHVLIVSIILS